ncbi:MAG TPA: isoprenylcysteine carboxylmethyltransferase family protein [Polyangiales bacterium]|nr:isoprenylcysteine carboxylmethyltransferase family protein [Polyangiales bacterium]
MTTILVLWMIYAALAFGPRTLLHWRATGDAGWSVFAAGKTWRERLPELLVALGCSISLGAAVLLWRKPMAAWDWQLPPALRTAALISYVAGSLLTVVSQTGMGRSWRIGVDPAERTALVVDGAFAIVRNPIYVGILVTCGALTLLAPSWLGCAGWALILLSLELQVRCIEEPYLLAVHGDAYRAYASRVGRFVPGVGCFTDNPSRTARRVRPSGRSQGAA